MFVPGKLFRPSIMFAGKAKSLPKLMHLSGAQLYLTLLKNIRLGLKGLPGTNTIAIVKFLILLTKKFYNIGP